MKRIYVRLSVVLLALAIWQTERAATAQNYSQVAPPAYAYRTPQRNYTGLMSGYEAWYMNDIRRRAEIGRQVDLESDIYWRWSGVSSYYPGVFEAWPMVPGGIWGWPAAISPPTVNSTRVAQQYAPDFAAAQQAEELPAPGPSFSPAAHRLEPRQRPAAYGPREF